MKLIVSKKIKDKQNKKGKEEARLVHNEDELCSDDWTQIITQSSDKGIKESNKKI